MSTPSGNSPQDKEFGLLGFIAGRPTNLPDPDADRVSSYPHLVVREFLAFGLMLATLLVVSFLFDAPLEELANPGKTPNPAKAPWYFLSLQEMLHYAPPFIGGVHSGASGRDHVYDPLLARSNGIDANHLPSSDDSHSFA